MAKGKFVANSITYPELIGHLSLFKWRRFGCGLKNGRRKDYDQGEPAVGYE